MNLIHIIQNSSQERFGPLRDRVTPFIRYLFNYSQYPIAKYAFIYHMLR
jgi:hypothetical protein